MTDEREVERLRARVAELEAAMATAGEPAPHPLDEERSRARSVLAAVLLVLACVLAPLSVVAVWASTQISDTDAYVQTVAPLAEDPAVQATIVDNVTAAINERLDLESLTTQALTALTQQVTLPPRLATVLPGLAGPISNGIENFIHTEVSQFVASPQFAEVWQSVNRVAHTQVVTLLEGSQGGALSAQGNTVTLNLGPVITEVKQRLVARGLTIAQQIPTIDHSFVLAESDAIPQAQGYYRLLEAAGTWLPIVTLILFAIGIYLARDRRRALVRGALGLVGAMLLLGVALIIMRQIYVGSARPGGLPDAGQTSVFDTLVRFLRGGLRSVAALGLVVAILAILTGPSPFAVRTRRFLEGGVGSMRRGAEAAGWNPGPVGAWTYRYKRQLQVGALFIAGFVLVFWTRPTAGVVVVVAIVFLLVLAVIEFLGRAPTPAGPAASAPPAAPAG